MQRHAPERIVSLLDPGRWFPDMGPAYSNKHLRLHFHDAHIATPECEVPTAEHVSELLAFVAVELADAALGRGGRMCQAITETGRGLSWDEVDAALRTTGEGAPFELRSEF